MQCFLPTEDFKYFLTMASIPCLHAQSLSRVQLFVAPWTVARQTPVPGISQARIPEWVAIPFSRESFSNPGIEPLSPVLAGRFLPLSYLRSPSKPQLYLNQR